MWPSRRITLSCRIEREMATVPILWPFLLQYLLPNAEHNLCTVNIQSGRWRRSMSGHSPWFSALGNIAVDPFFVGGHNAMQKPLPILSLKQLFTSKETPFSISRLQLIRNPISMALRRFEMACWVTPNDSTNSSCVLHGSSASNASNSESSKILSFPLPCRSSTSKSPLLNRWNHSRHVLSLRAASP